MLTLGRSQRIDLLDEVPGLSMRQCVCVWGGGGMLVLLVPTSISLFPAYEVGGWRGWKVVQRRQTRLGVRRTLQTTCRSLFFSGWQ